MHGIGFKLHLRLWALLGSGLSLSEQWLGTGLSLSEQWHVMLVNARSSAAHDLRAANLNTKSQPPQCFGSTPVEG